MKFCGNYKVYMEGLRKIVYSYPIWPRWKYRW